MDNLIELMSPMTMARRPIPKEESLEKNLLGEVGVKFRLSLLVRTLLVD